MNAMLQRFSVILGFSLLVILLLINAGLTKRQIDVLVADEGWVEHTRQVRFSLSQTQLLIDDAETGQRGFLFTGDPKYLVPYETASAQLTPSLDNLARLTRDNPMQQTHLANLRNLVGLKLEELTQTIALYRSGKTAEARALVLTDRGLSLMNGIRDETDQMQREESSLETQRAATYERSIRGAVASLFLATGMALIGLVALARYVILERRNREEHARQMRAREEWFRVTLTSIGDAVIATDAQGIVTFLNPVAEALTGFGLAEAKGIDVQKVFPIMNEVSGEKAENPVEKVLKLGIVVGLANHTVLQHRDGHLVPIEDSAAPIRDDNKQTIGVVLVFRDVTAERNSQEMMRRTEKLAAAARLSATVAHEINNPLEAVVNLLFIAKSSPGATPEIVENLKLAEEELERVAHITRQTLGFYRESNTSELIEIASVVQPILRLYSSRIAAKKVEVKFTAEGCPPVWGVAGELKQVIANLVANAIDAVPKGGRIFLCCTCAETPKGKFAEILIEDDGPGVAPELLDRIFDPFFTTKQDVGTGLGLWVAKEIIVRHGGSIEVRPARAANGHNGAGFVIRLPIATAKHAVPLR
jgi:PAS domain S-box-containing protein